MHTVLKDVSTDKKEGGGQPLPSQGLGSEEYPLQVQCKSITRSLIFK